MINLASIVIDTDAIFAVSGAVVVALASIWAIRKVIKLANRS